MHELIHRELSEYIIGATMNGYRAITGLQLALLINFKFARLGWKRVVRTQEKTS